jgi:hypothetical protein
MLRTANHFHLDRGLFWACSLTPIALQRSNGSTRLPKLCAQAR